MTNLFTYFTGDATHIYFPGAPFLPGAVLTLISVILAICSLTAPPPKTEVIEEKIIAD